MQAGLHATRLGASENDVAADIMAAAIRAGSEYLGMEPFVTSGPRGGVPHTTWRRRKIESGDLVALETCACYNRYHAALFRTVGVGKIPPEAEDMYKACQEGLDAAIEKLRPGNTCADVHNAVQAVIDRYGYTAAYRKRTGYSIGISFSPDWGEGNILSLFHDVDRSARAGHGISRAGSAAQLWQVYRCGERNRGCHQRPPKRSVASAAICSGFDIVAAAPVGPPEPDAALARRLFDELDRHTRQGAGITRASMATVSSSPTISSQRPPAKSGLRYRPMLQAISTQHWKDANPAQAPF